MLAVVAIGVVSPDNHHALLSFRSRLPMRTIRALTACSLIAALGLAASVRAENWPAWRGPTGQGHSTETNVPLKWSAKENVKWKVALESPGNSTPIIWGDKIFITQANKDPNPK